MKRVNRPDWPATAVLMVLLLAIVGTVGGFALWVISPRSPDPTPTSEIVYPRVPTIALPTATPWPAATPYVYTFPNQPTPAATIPEIDLMARTLACETQIFFDENGHDYGTGAADAIAIVQVFKRRHEISGKSWEDVIRQGSACWTEYELPDYLVRRRDLFWQDGIMSFDERRAMLEIASGAMYGWYEDLMPGATHFYDSEKLITPPTWADERCYVGSLGPHKYYRIWPDVRR